MNEKKRNKYTVVVVVLLLFGILHLFFKYRKSEIKSTGVYTVGKVTGYYAALSSSPEIHFTYFVAGKKIRIPNKFDGDYSKVEDKFFRVRYVPEHPSWGEIQLNYPVKDSVKIIEAGLWFTKSKQNQYWGQKD